MSDEAVNATTRVPHERWFVAVSDDNVYERDDQLEPGERFIHLSGDRLSTSWPALPAGVSPADAFMHPTFQYPRWPFSVYEVVPGPDAFIDEVGERVWARSQDWTVVRRLEQQEAFGPNGEHVVALLNSMTEGPALTTGAAFAMLERMATQLNDSGAIYEGTLSERIHSLYRDVAVQAANMGLEKELAIAQGVARHFGGSFAIGEQPMLLYLAAAWSVVFGDTIESPVANVGPLVAGGTYPRISDDTHIQYKWVRSPAPSPQAATTTPPVTGLGEGDEVSDSEMDWLRGIEERMSTRLVGHADNIAAFAHRMRSKRLGLIEPKQPVSVVALGPSGNGKTEFFRTVADKVFGDEKKIGIVDMGLCPDHTDVTKLTGASPKYVGYGDSILLDAVLPFATFDEDSKTYTVRGVVLFDEMDKAHEKLYDAVMQVLDEGRIVLGNGRIIDMRQAVVGITGNFGTSDMRVSSIGFAAVRPVAVESTVMAANLDDQVVRGLRDKATEAWNAATRPEFRNRVKVTLHFDPLTNDQLGVLTHHKLDAVLARTARLHKLDVTYGDDVVNLIRSHNVDRLKGGRAVSDNIEALVDTAITEAVMDRKRGAFRLVAEDGSIALRPQFAVVPPAAIHELAS